MGLGLPVTLRDSTYQHSTFGSSFRLRPIMTAIALPGILGVWLGGFFFPDTPAQVGIGSRVGMLGSGAVAAISGGCLLMLYLRKTGYVRLDPANWEAKLERTFDSIRVRGAGHSGTVILHCEDGFWRDAVMKAAFYADAAVLDVGQVTENIAWELNSLLLYLPPESILLLFPVSAGLEPITSGEITDSLNNLCQNHLVERCRRLTYIQGTKHQLNRVTRQYVQRKAAEVRHHLINAITTSRTNGVWWKEPASILANDKSPSHPESDGQGARQASPDG